MRRVLAGLAGLLVLTLGASACGLGPDRVVQHADYPAFESAEKLFDEADLVVEADVATDFRVTTLLPEPPTGADPLANPQAGAPAGETPDGVVTTVRTARVVRVFKGTAGAGQTIEVGEPGGTIDGVTYEVAGAVPLTGGARHVLFLHTYPGAPASLVNPYQGQYRVDAGGGMSRVAGNEVPLSRSELNRLAVRR